jgi:hypothetical protein
VREVLLRDPDLVHFERGLRDITAGLLARYVSPNSADGAERP